MKLFFENVKKRYFVLTCIFIFLIPLFWTNFGDNNFGGDSSRLYYFFSKEWLLSYSLNLINFGFSDHIYHGNTALNFQVFFYFLLNLISQNLSIWISNSVVFFLSFLSINLLLDDLFKIENKFVIFKLLISLFYSCSWLTAYSIYYNGGFWIFSFSATPLITIFFFRFLIFNKLRFFIIFLILIYLFSGVFLYQILSFNLPIFLTISFLYFIAIKKYKYKIQIKNFLILIFIVLTFNFHYVFSVIHELLNHPPVIGSADNLGKRVSYAKGLFEIIQNNYYSILSLGNLDILIRSGDPVSIKYKSYLYFLSYINIFFPLLIILSFFLIKNKKNNKFFRSLLLIFLINFFLINMAFNNITSSFFIFVFDNFNLFSMYRSYLHKFSFSYGIIFTILIFSCVFLTKIYLNKKLYVTLCIILFLNIIPFIVTNPSKAPIWRSTGYVIPINGFGDHFIQMNKELKFFLKRDYGNILSLPFTREYELHENGYNNAYVGPSIVPLLNITKNYIGTVNSQTQKIYEYFETGDIENIKKKIKELEIKYIVMNKYELNNLEYYLLSAKFNSHEKLLETIEKMKFSKVYENKMFYIFKTFKTEISKNCYLIDIIRSTKVYLENTCNLQVNSKEFDSVIRKIPNFKNYKVYEIVPKIEEKLFFKYSTFQYLGKKEILGSDLSKHKNLKKVVIIYEKQIIYDFLLLISFFTPLFFAFYLLLKKNEKKTKYF